MTSLGGDTLKTFKVVKKLLKRNSNARDRILYPGEFDRLMEHSKNHLRGIVATGYYTGMREGEILNLTWNKVDLKNRVINLEPADTKDKEARKIPICKELYGILTKEVGGHIRNASDDGYVFLYRRKSVKNINKTLKTACGDAGILYGRFAKGGFVFHDLRHTFNTYMRKAGVAESVIMEITGHSTREMFDRYNTIDEEDTRKAVDQLEAFLANVDQTVDQVDENENSEIAKA